MEDVREWLRSNREACKEELIQLASIPSVSANPAHSEHCLQAAQWLEKRAKVAGLEVRLNSSLCLEYSLKFYA